MTNGPTTLENLPEDHPLRTTPLRLIGAEYCHVQDVNGWLPATQEKLGDFCFNDLYGPWVEFHRWRVAS